MLVAGAKPTASLPVLETDDKNVAIVCTKKLYRTTDDSESGLRQAWIRGMGFLWCGLPP